MGLSRLISEAAERSRVHRKLKNQVPMKDP